MPLTEISPELADAADVLSDQLRVHLHRLAAFLLPHADVLDRRFLAKLKAGTLRQRTSSSQHFDNRQLDPKIRMALAAITPGAAARILASGQPPLKFIEQVEYNGRRLAKLNLPPSSIVEALQEYDRLLTPLLRKLLPNEYANFQWVREQLHFCVILTLNNAYYQVRESETQAFYELFRVELESRNLDELLRRFLDALVQVCRADAGHLYLLNNKRSSWALRAQAHGRGHNKPALVQVPNGRLRMRTLARSRQVETKEPKSGTLLLEPGWKDRFQTVWSIPLAAGGRTAGVMQFGFAKSYEWLPREQELLAAAAERCLMAAEKARLVEHLAAREEQVRQLAEHMLHVEEMERRRISRELHDEAGQSLLCIRLQMELLEGAIPAEHAEWIGKLREARDLTERTILEMRRLIAALSPAVLEQLGLGAALRQLVNRFRRLHPIRVKLALGRLRRLPQHTEIIVYRLVQECCNNIAKHSAASNVNISVSSADGWVRLAVEDNGVGFRVEEALARKDSFGLSGMRERVALLGGRFEIRSFPKGASGVGARPGKSVERNRTGRGTKILIRLPVAKQLPESSSVEPITAKPIGAKPMGVRPARRIGAVGA
ncbi:MAG TPA: GAF domain-containing sensor histidine kinase [Bryobacteraceae bacterium]|nr:GAF domain-containing sensor histidine kinase [Bryobacteraceae bacterium]